MGLAFIIVLLLFSLLLVYQSLAVYGVFNGVIDRLSLGLFNDSVMSLISIKISSWGLVFGICGLSVCVLCFLRKKSGNDLDKQCLILGILIMIFGIVSVL